MLNPEKIKKAEWVKDDSLQEVFLRVKVNDVPGALNRVLAKISEKRINISYIQGRSLGDGTAEVELVIQVNDVGEYKKAIEEISRIEDVFAILRK